MLSWPPYPPVHHTDPLPRYMCLPVHSLQECNDNGFSCPKSLHTRQWPFSALLCVIYSDLQNVQQYYRTYPYIRKALENGNYEDVVVCSKCLEPDYESMMEAIEEARLELDREVIDIFLMHEVRSGQLEERAGAWEALKDAKAKGLVKAVGISTHHVDVAMDISKVPECDVVFPLINFAGLGIRKGNGRGTQEEMMESIRACYDDGKGIFSMKAFGGGPLMGQYQKALKYILEKPEIHSAMIGFGSTKDIDDLFDYVDGKMPSNYNPDISKKRMIVEQSDCEGCGNCKRVCPADAIFYNENGLAEIDPQKCLTCGYCAPACPTRALIMY